MRRFFVFSLLSLALASPAFAASPIKPIEFGKEGEISRQPDCANLINRSSVTMNGTIALMPQTLPDGKIQQYMDNFKLAPNESREICASGPFYAGRRLELTIRSLIPLFSCKTSLAGDIHLDMSEDYEGVKQYSATCR